MTRGPSHPTSAFFANKRVTSREAARTKAAAEAPGPGGAEDEGIDQRDLARGNETQGPVRESETGEDEGITGTENMTEHATSTAATTGDMTTGAMIAGTKKDASGSTNAPGMMTEDAHHRKGAEVARVLSLLADIERKEAELLSFINSSGLHLVY